MELKKAAAALSGFFSEGTKRTNLIIILAAAAALLVLIPGQSCSRQEPDPAEEISCAQYARELEEQLCAIISSVDGAGETHVMITLQNGVEYVYASEDSISTDNSASTAPDGRQSSDEREDHQSSLIIIDTDQGEQALVRTELMPSVNGVVIVCRGGSDPEVSRRIMSVVTTALDISPKRVCITQLSQ